MPRVNQKDCDKYNLPINTMWIQRDSCEDNKRFKCKRGYVSQVQTTCKNEVWILEPACQECTQGVNITNSDDVTESRIFGEDFSFNCSVGYTKNGETGTLRCDVNGMWLEQQACQECTQGVNITNSDDVTESRIFGEDFSFNCSVGYTKNGGTGTLRCGENGMWLEQQACQAVECPQGVNITNSDDVTESRIFGEDFSFNCSVGSTKNGETGTLRCGVNGTWTEQQACPGCYKFLNKTCLAPSFFYYDDYTSTEDDQCDEDCNSITGCTASLYESNNCNFYTAPIIFVSYDLDLNQCIEKCKERSDCVTLNLKTGISNECFLFNVTLAELPDGSTTENDRCTIVEKIC
ncbi:hypothetical protein LOTGIDRAFT_175613 [Lottia gigantea]|uniref:Sushi domain-containing protein n=1 Tax=Lottia gigantea TaxID=225164 RepID=V3ZP38_LOTGI|nr:hypothetical protein LOTGIDRAFT_175613 [Lottia gigantea]ESO93158.1 hypothetical protein LOTGIDRAFT_175613 [Lottia gigantea]